MRRGRERERERERERKGERERERERERDGERNMHAGQIVCLSNCFSNSVLYSTELALISMATSTWAPLSPYSLYWLASNIIRICLVVVSNRPTNNGGEEA